MLVDNPLPLFHNFGDDISDLFHSDLFLPSTSSASSSSASNASSPASPFPHLTPPQQSPLPAFPEPSSTNFYSLFDEETKQSDSYDFLSTQYDANSLDFNAALAMDMNMGIDINPSIAMDLGIDIRSDNVCIDPQLVDTPAPAPALNDFDTLEQDVKEADKDKEAEPEKLSLTITPMKVGGHGKARRGTVQSGGVVKNVATASSTVKSLPAVVKSSAVRGAQRDKENSGAGINSTSTSTSALVDKSLAKDNFNVRAQSVTSNRSQGNGIDDDEDDLPQDWRPSPEVFAKMSSKEKRQLRNKISARNFRVRRKEYISTLEGDIAERDRLLDAIRSELGSTQSENAALRREIAALKRVLLDGRGNSNTTSTDALGKDDFLNLGADSDLVNLPPPAPLGAISAAEMLRAAGVIGPDGAVTSPSSPTASTSQTASPSLLAPNTNKDVRTSGGGGRFWGGVMGGLGGVTPVHTTFVPQTPLRAALMENVNPALNANNAVRKDSKVQNQSRPPLGFDNFADLNPFTMKTLDAYRMHLWGKMAAQHHWNQQQQQQQQQQQTQKHLSNFNGANSPTSAQFQNLISGMRPHYFSKTNNLQNTPTSPPGYSTTISALLSGKQIASSAYPSPPASPKITSRLPREEKEQQQRANQHQQERDAALLAAMASQTLFRKLGSAFWDAFSGSSTSSYSPSTSTHGAKNWDPEKVRRVLEGTAVVRVVDVDATPPVQTQTASTPTRSVTPTQSASTSTTQQCQDNLKKCSMSELLEESMRSLSISKGR